MTLLEDTRSTLIKLAELVEFLADDGDLSVRTTNQIDHHVAEIERLINSENPQKR